MDHVSGSDEEDQHTKVRQVLRRLQVGQYTSYFAKDVYRCPFCTRRLGGTDYRAQGAQDQGTGEQKLEEKPDSWGLTEFSSAHLSAAVLLSPGDVAEVQSDDQWL
ncbi:hypothetical protein QYE76_036147 [Lolium multiflorum]|uniref:Uncharacterized protein n=1 Tax=Lolium multiflorum TaxID=4521 RepID=A0AAD8R323_LOLMU|nr:hypothetical protein QYE76_036147 [Lolium multiflorum]